MERRTGLEVDLKSIRMRTPLMTASGTSGTKGEVENLRRGERVLGSLGAFVTKGVSLEPRRGNPQQRLVETRTGCINSIGLQNSGARVFMSEELPRMAAYGLPLIVNISAGSVEEFGKLAEYLAEHDNNMISGLEINVSCPNIREGGMAFGTNPRLVEKIVKTIRKATRGRYVIITKLTPNITDITVPARAAIAGGTDALSMINTVRGMAIDIEKQKPTLGNVVGGLSGPAIKPIGLAMVYQCFKGIPECRDRRVPIVGIGGITYWQDALEYIMAGATAVGIGTAWFVDTDVFANVAQGMLAYLKKRNTTIDKLVGIAHKA
ncbi:MAG: dihydroorotate dehydrogenase [Candidatus Sumerlaeia bacterium]